MCFRLLAVVLALLLLPAAAPRASYAQQVTTGTSGTAPDTGRAGTGVVSGTVYDSVARAPLLRAVVQLMADGPTHAVYTTMSDVTGRFALRNVPAGSYEATFFHPALYALGLEPVERRIAVSPETPTRLNFAIPSSTTIWSITCRPTNPVDSTGMLLGHVRDAETGAPVARAQVTVRWTELRLDSAFGISTQPELVTAETDESGTYGICGVPSDGSVEVRAVHGAAGSGPLTVEVPEREVLQTEIAISAARTRVTLTGDSAGLDSGRVVVRGTARLAGTVRSPSGQPMGDVELLLLGAGARGRTASDGAFVLTDLPAGTYMLETRRIGLAPERVIVDLASDRTTRTEVTVREAVVLSAVTVYGKAQNRVRMQRLSGFLQRRRVGLGRFLTHEEIERRQPSQTTDLLRSMPGVNIVSNSDLTTRVLVRGGWQYCPPTVYVDGLPVFRPPPPTGGLPVAAAQVSGAQQNRGTRRPGQGSSSASNGGTSRRNDVPGGDPVNRPTADGDTEGAEIDRYIAPEDIAAIEVYADALSTPAQFRGRSCGSIVIWSRYAFPEQQRADSGK